MVVIHRTEPTATKEHASAVCCCTSGAAVPLQGYNQSHATLHRDQGLVRYNKKVVLMFDFCMIGAGRGYYYTAAAIC